MDAGAAGRQRLHCHHADPAGQHGDADPAGQHGDADQAGQHGDEVLQHDIIEQLPISEKKI